MNEDQEQTPINPVLLIIAGILAVLLVAGVIIKVYKSQEACRLLLDILSFMGPLISSLIPSYGGAFPC